MGSDWYLLGYGGADLPALCPRPNSRNRYSRGSTLIGAVGIIAISHRGHRRRSDDFGIGRSFPGPTRNSALVLLVATLAISAGILVLASL